MAATDKLHRNYVSMTAVLVLGGFAITSMVTGNATEHLGTAIAGIVGVLAAHQLSKTRQ